jgi:hypothetical protein
MPEPRTLNSHRWDGWPRGQRRRQQRRSEQSPSAGWGRGGSWRRKRQREGEVEHDGVSVQCALMPLWGGGAQVSARTRTINTEHFTLASSQPNMADRARCRRKLCPTSMSQRPLNALEVRGIKFRLRQCTTRSTGSGPLRPTASAEPTIKCKHTDDTTRAGVGWRPRLQHPADPALSACPPCCPPASVCSSSNPPPPGTSPSGPAARGAACGARAGTQAAYLVRFLCTTVARSLTERPLIVIAYMFATCLRPDTALKRTSCGAPPVHVNEYTQGQR